MAPHSVSTTHEKRSPALVSVDGRTYPLRSALIRGRAEGGLAQTTLVQEFHNPHAEPLEVLYTMPLPADGAVLGYTVRMGERVIRGEIQPREKAEAAYREALYSGRSAGLLEQDRADTFHQRLGNVPPHTDVQVEIDVLHPLAFLAAVDDTGPLWEYRFPTVVSVRYQGAPGRVPDSKRLDVDRVDAETGEIPTRFDANLTVADDVVTRGGVASPSHEIRCIANAIGVCVTLSEDARLDRDLVLRWAASVDEVGVRLTEGGGLPGDDGRYALLTITPPKMPAVSFHRDLTVLLDASGSMSGEPIETAKRIVAGLLESLEPEDRFEVLAFASKTRALTRGLEGASAKAVKKAIGEVQGLHADGGTEMVSAFEKALESLRRDSQRQIVLVTDGQIGFEDELLAKLGKSLPSGVRVHAIGIGSAVNRTLTMMVSRAGRGTELIAADLGTAAETVRRIRTATVRPILTEVHLGGSALAGVAPRNPRDVFAGQPLVMAAELMPGGGTIEVSARLAGSKDAWVWRTEVNPAASAGAVAATLLPIGALYGRESITDLEACPMGAGNPATLEARIEALGMRHRITSRATSLVAIAEEPSVDPLAPRRREKLAVELPAGVSVAGVGLDMAMGSMTLGRSAFRLSDTAVLGQFKAAYDPLARSVEPVFAAREETLAGTSRVLVAEAIEAHDDELTLEVEAPEDGFLLPAGELEVAFRDGRRVTAVVVSEKSTPAGPHPGGTRLRLTIRLTGGASWPAMGIAMIEWPGTTLDGDLLLYRVPVNLDRARHARAGR
jgi:Ca-activated chloride channel family protein